MKLSLFVILTMGIAFNKSETIAKAARDYISDPDLTLRAAGKINEISPQSVLNYVNRKTTPAPDVYASH
jgi:hypothetical protein